MKIKLFSQWIHVFPFVTMTSGISGEIFNDIPTFYPSLEPLYSVDFSTRSFFIIPLNRHCREILLYFDLFADYDFNRNHPLLLFYVNVQSKTFFISI